MGHQFSIRLPDRIERRLAAYIEKEQAKRSWGRVSRSSVIVEALGKFLPSDAPPALAPRHPLPATSPKVTRRAGVVSPGGRPRKAARR